MFSSECFSSVLKMLIFAMCCERYKQNIMKYLCVFLLFLLSLELFSQVTYQDLKKFNSESVFKEEFTNNTQHWNIKEDYPIYSTLEKGNLKLTTFDQLAFCTRRILFDVKDNFQIEAAIKFLTGDSNSCFGLSFGGDNTKYISKRNYFGIAPGPGKAEVGVYKYEPELLADKTGIAKIKMDGYNLLTIRKIKNNLYYFVNEELVLTTKALKFDGNAIGFYCSPGLSVLIDYINIFLVAAYS